MNFNGQCVRYCWSLLPPQRTTRQARESPPSPPARRRKRQRKEGSGSYTYTVVSYPELQEERTTMNFAMIYFDAMRCSFHIIMLRNTVKPELDRIEATTMFCLGRYVVRTERRWSAPAILTLRSSMQVTISRRVTGNRKPAPRSCVWLGSPLAFIAVVRSTCSTYSA